MRKESELVTVSSKGQVVIPQEIRRELGLKSKTKLLVYGEGSTIVLRKIKIPKIYRDWAGIFDMAEKKKLKLTARDIQKEIEAYRKERMAKMTK